MNANWLDTNFLSPQKRFVNFNWAENSRPDVKFVKLEKTSVLLRTAGDGDLTIVFMTDSPNVVEHYDCIGCFAELPSRATAKAVA